MPVCKGLGPRLGLPLLVLQAVIIEKFDPGLLKRLLNGDVHGIAGHPLAVLEVLNRLEANPRLTRKGLLLPIEQASGGAALCGRNPHMGMVSAGRPACTWRHI